MARKHPIPKRPRSGLAATLALALVGLLLATSRLGDALERFSFDLPFVFGHSPIPTNVLVISMDGPSHSELGQDYGKLWDRTLHARLLDRLRQAPGTLVVMDILFAGASRLPEADQALARAIRQHGNVLLAATFEEQKAPGLAGLAPELPLSLFYEAAGGTNALGASGHAKDPDSVIRWQSGNAGTLPSLAWLAASRRLSPASLPPDEPLQRGIRYCGPAGSIRTISYSQALLSPPILFRNTTVFIGGHPATPMLGEASDEFGTPFTRWDGATCGGVEVHATAFHNLVSGDSLHRLPRSVDFLLAILVGAAGGLGLTRLRLPYAFATAVAAALLFAVLAAWLQYRYLIWFNWAIPVAIQLPLALAFVLPAQLRPRARLLPIPPDMPTASDPDPGTPTAPMVVHDPTNHHIPDYQLLNRVGSGAYGEVWIAQNRVGILQIVKIIHEQHMTKAAFDREFEGVRAFMPVSWNHPNVVRITHIGRSNRHGFFYYIMEAADDAEAGRDIDPATYAPMDLGRRMAMAPQHRFTPAECLQIVLPLASALAYLHEHRLVHRDIKPGNIIFVDAVPKLADIGLVTSLADRDHTTRLGTVGYIPDQGLGTAQADVYGLGKVLYELLTGQPCEKFPELPSALLLSTPSPAFTALNSIILKACEEDPRHRYASGREFHQALLQLQQAPEFPAGPESNTRSRR